MSKTNQNHIVGIDLLRFVAACLVVVFHYGFLMGINPGGLIGSASRKMVAFPELYDYSYFGWIGVQIFFVISGFVIAFSGERATPFSFFRSRIVRLGPAVWICAPLTLVATLLVGFRPTSELYRAFRHSMTFLPWEPWIDGSYWTLGIEIAFYTTVFALISIGRFKFIRVLAIVIGVVSSSFWIGLLILHILRGSSVDGFLGTLSTSRLLRLLLVQYGVFFSIGVLLWSELMKEHRIGNIFWILIFSATGCIGIVLDLRLANSDFGTTYSAYVPCSIWIASIGFIIWSVRYNAVMHSLPLVMVDAIKTSGMMTFPLYLLHQIIGGATMGELVGNGINRWIALSITIIGMLAATWFIAKHVEPRLQTIVKSLISAIYARCKSLKIGWVKSNHD